MTGRDGCNRSNQSVDASRWETSQSKELHLGNVPWMSVGLLAASTGLVRRGLSWTVRGIEDGNVYCSCAVLPGGSPVRSERSSPGNCARDPIWFPEDRPQR